MMRVLELFGGIGGMHHALRESGLPHQVVASVDINTTANEVYTHNFPNTAVMNKTIEGLSLEDFELLSFEVLLMSPPCQPFTRIGRQRDLADPRTKSFLHIVDLLPRLSKAPVFILLENVKGFEKSAAREHLVKTLMECHYSVQEVMVSPTHFGIPNSRLRYYLMAKLSGQKCGAQMGSVLPTFTASPDDVQSTPSSPHVGSPEDTSHPRDCWSQQKALLEVQRKENQNRDLSIKQIQDFLEPDDQVDIEQHLVPSKTLLRYALLMDIVQPTCRRSICFTKGYGKFVEGTGSVLQCCMDTSVEHVFSSLEQCSEEEKIQKLLELRLRYFTPREVANLMGFPQSFSFPETVSTKQQYRLLGNSLNVLVVAKLLQFLVSQ